MKSPAASILSNRLRVTKKYSRPSFSPARRGRVVCETEKAKSGREAISRLTKVDLPHPDGAEMTKMLARP
jgi:hypothetical protein